MHSLKTRITLLTVMVVIIAVIVVTLLSVVFIRSNERRETDQLLLLLCETGERNLDYYFNSVQKSVGKVASYVEADLDGLDDASLRRHMDSVGKYFEEMAYKTSGVLTYYYRIDPEVSQTVKGFWYTDLDGDGFVEHEVTDITLYDTADTSKLVWFTVPKVNGESVWLSPYITDNLDVRVISYNVPVRWKGQFVGVVGIEIEYTFMAKQVESIRLHQNGYAFLSNEDGELFFHPRIDVTQMDTDELPEVPEGALSESTFFSYTFDGVEKQAAWLPLSNGMRLNVTVPVSEADGDWQKLISEILIASVIVLITLSLFTLFFTGRITKPLQKLTEAAVKLDQGQYDFDLEYRGNDEVGRLTNTFKALADHMKVHITDLNKRVYVDALTSVRNKGAFSAYIDDLQSKVDAQASDLAFAVSVFDCDNLKYVNDQFGHDKGDEYLKTASRLICRIFQHSPVFRIGGDEFAVVLQNDDYMNRQTLFEAFDKESQEICGAVENIWEQVHVSHGTSVYDPQSDNAVIDVVRRADKEMYTNKRQGKKNS